MLHRVLFVSLFLVFYSSVTNCYPSGSRVSITIIKTDTFSHPGPIGHSIMGPIHAVQVMNTSGMPKEIANVILQLHWLLGKDERAGWDYYICLLNSRMQHFKMRGDVTMMDVMSLTQQEKEDFQLIRREVSWSNGDFFVGLSKDKFKKMPLRVKNKFKKDTNKQNCICM